MDIDNILSNGAGTPPQTQQPPAANPQPTTPQTQPEQPAANPQPTTPPAWNTLIDENGGLSQNWKQFLPEDIRNDNSLDRIKTFATLAKSYVNAQHAIGKGRVAIPTSAATDEEWSEVYSKLGRPDDANGYKSEALQNIPDGAIKDSVKAAFFEAGLSDKQVDKVLQMYNSIEQEGMRAAEEYRKNSEAELRAEWGRKYEMNLATAKQAAESLGILEALNGSEALNNPAFIRILHKIGEERSESTLINGRGNNQGDLGARIREITGNPQDPYYNASHPNHQARVAEVSRLLKLQAQYK